MSRVDKHGTVGAALRYDSIELGFFFIHETLPMTDVRTSSSTKMRLQRFVAVGLLAAVGFMGTGKFALAAALASTNVQPASLVAGATSTVTVTFTTTTTIPANGKIVVVFGAGFNVAGASGGACPSMDGVFSTGVVGQTVTLTRSTGGVQTAAVESCTIGGIVNPSVSGSTGTYTITTTDASDTPLDTDAAVAADTITAAALTSTNVAPGGTTVGTRNTATVTFTTVNQIPADGKVKVTFGSGFVVSGASSFACSTLTGGSVATTIASQTVILTRTGGDIEAAGAQTCTIAGIVNPVTAGSTGAYTISTTNSSDAIIDTDAAVTADTMLAASSSSNAVANSTPLTYDISLSAPAASAAYAAGDEITITWSTSGGTGTVSAVNLDYSTDGGSTFTSIVSATANDGSYVWTAPDISAQSITIRAQATDLLTVLDTDTSDAFSIGTEVGGGDTDETPAEDVDTSEGSTTLLPEGTFFKGESWDTVYYVDGTTRRPFLDAQTFFTYVDNFDAVIETSDDYLANYAIGTPMLPKAGTVLVKVVSVNNVYALEADNTLRWISSESLASSLYGSNWADYVIDVPVTAWGHFTIGEDVESVNDIEVDESMMETRDALNSK